MIISEYEYECGPNWHLIEYRYDMSEYEREYEFLIVNPSEGMSVSMSSRVSLWFENW